MTWTKLGRVYAPDTANWWSQLYGILPTPILDRKSGRLQVYFATTDSERFGRISRLDLDPENPTRVLHTTSPMLEPGEPGTFDDCGVNPCSAIDVDGERWLYYVGYQRTIKVPYLLLSGLACERGGKLERLSRTPILERNHDEPWIRSAPSVIRAGGQWKMWYVSATDWQTHTTGLFAGRMMPKYNLRHAVSEDGRHWTVKGGPVLDEQPGEFGFGRPWVLYDDSGYRMWYSIRRTNISYRIGYATSDDGEHWTRRDAEAGIDVSPHHDWDSEMICYPAVVRVGQREYLFYNGNRNGESGFGVAVRE